MNTIGERFKEWRKSNNLTTSEIAKNCNISQSGLSAIELNKTLLGTKVILAICEKYDFDIVWILTGKETNSNNLAENEKELLKYFSKLPEREQIKIIGIVEEKANDIKMGKSSDSKIG